MMMKVSQLQGAFLPPLQFPRQEDQHALRGS
jgi:hypothetical protein